MKNSSLLFLLIFTINLSCNNSVPKGIVNQAEMQKVYWDLLLADNLSKAIVKKDSTKNLSQVNIQYINQVLAIHKMNKNDLERNINYYQKHPDILAAIFDSIQLQESKKVGRPWESQYSKPK